MYRRLPIVLTLVAWLLATGVQWDLLQVFGWARMVVNHSQTMSITAAVTKTLGGEMCGVCEIVSQAKRRPADAAPAGGPHDAKVVLLVPAAPAFVFSAPDPGVWSAAPSAALSVPRTAPPLPPPRA